MINTREEFIEAYRNKPFSLSKLFLLKQDYDSYIKWLSNVINMEFSDPTLDPDPNSDEIKNALTQIELNLVTILYRAIYVLELDPHNLSMDYKVLYDPINGFEVTTPKWYPAIFAGSVSLSHQESTDAEISDSTIDTVNNSLITHFISRDKQDIVKKLRKRLATKNVSNCLKSFYDTHYTDSNKSIN